MELLNQLKRIIQLRGQLLDCELALVCQLEDMAANSHLDDNIRQLAHQAWDALTLDELSQARTLIEQLEQAQNNSSASGAE